MLQPKKTPNDESSKKEKANKMPNIHMLLKQKKNLLPQL
jgi:hypothetical protein